MQDAIYHVVFSSSVGAGGEGLAVIKNGSVNGGDNGYLYQGALNLSGDKVSGTLQISRWNRTAVSVFGPLDQFKLQLSGAVNDNGFTVSGGIPNQPGLTITIRGRRLAEAA